jgi:hypothetical protein
MYRCAERQIFFLFVPFLSLLPLRVVAAEAVQNQPEIFGGRNTAALAQGVAATRIAHTCAGSS